MLKPKSIESSQVCTVLFFAAFLGLGLSVVRDYGLYLDELTNHYFGVHWYNYVRGIVVDHAPLASMPGQTEHDIIHGPVFEMALAFIEDAFPNPTEMRTILFFRHHAVWVIFYLSVLSFYFLARRLCEHRGLALLACFFLVIQPRIFAHSFYDSVDTSFLSGYIFGLFTLVRYLDRRTIGSIGLHALACALLIDVRSMGAIIPVITVAYIGLDFIFPNNSAVPLRHRLIEVGVFFPILIGTVVVFWPYLWNDPLARVMDVLRITPRIDWGGSVLYLGQIVDGGELPWHYIPLWLLITTPIAIGAFFVVGLLDLLSCAVRSPGRFYREQAPQAVIAAAFLTPLMMVLLLRPVVYDSWRHFFFIYPAFALIAVMGVKKILVTIGTFLDGRWRTAVKGVIAAAVAANFVSVGWFMVENHPYQNVYFNQLAGKDMSEIKRRFELDYWGLSFREALEYVMAHDDAPKVNIFAGEYFLLTHTRQMLPSLDERRINEVGFDQAKYVITIFRLRREGYPTLPEYFSVKVGGASLVTVYRKETKAK
jgi:hypothetical protein